MSTNQGFFLQGIGFILGLNSISLTIGPIMAGVLYDKFRNYTLAFLLAGVPPLVGALFMCLIHRVGNKNNETEESIKSIHVDEEEQLEQCTQA